MQMCNATPGYTNPQYWEQAAKSWEDIQDTFVTDEQMIIRRTLSRHLNLNDHVIDFGCGGGRYLQYLSGRCRRVLGLDISESLIDLAIELVRKKKLLNVELKVADIGFNGVVEKLGPALPVCTAAICTNVLLSPEPRTRANIMALMANRLRPGGKLFIVVPAVSSALNIRAQHVRWLKERRKRNYKVNAKVEAAEHSDAADERRGIFERMGVRHQHYKLSDLQDLLSEHGFVLIKAERVEYSWSTEFDKPTKFLDRDPNVSRPFDWLVVAERATSLLKSASVPVHAAVPQPPAHRAAPVQSPSPPPMPPPPPQQQQPTHCIAMVASPPPQPPPGWQWRSPPPPCSFVNQQPYKVARVDPNGWCGSANLNSMTSSAARSWRSPPLCSRPTTPTYFGPSPAEQARINLGHLAKQRKPYLLKVTPQSGLL